MPLGLPCRHCEQSEPIQTWAAHLRLSLGCFAVARNDDLPVFTRGTAAPRCPSVNQAEPPERARAKPRFFPRFVCFQAFARRKSFPLCLADAAPARRRRGSAIATEPTVDRRRRSRRIENPRIVSSADRASRLHPRRWAFRRPADRARTKSRFLPHFVSFQGLARRKISAPVETRIAHPRHRRTAPCRKRL